MPIITQIRGMLIEETIIYLLRLSGYSPITMAIDDSVEKISGSLWVKGRGESHQIDAIADQVVSVPFTYPQRLLVEGKCHSHTVGIEIVRNAVGVLKDVGEYWALCNITFHYFGGNWD